MDQEDTALPPSLRALKWLVIVLTLTMIIGVITVVAVLVTRIPQVFGGASARLPDNLALPEGSTPQAVTFGEGWIGVVTSDSAGRQSFLVFAPDGALRQTVLLQPGP